MASTVSIDLRHVVRGLGIDSRKSRPSWNSWTTGIRSHSSPVTVRTERGAWMKSRSGRCKSRLAKTRFLAERKQTILPLDRVPRETDRETRQADPVGQHDQTAGGPVPPLQAQEADAGHFGPGAVLEPLAMEILEADPAGCGSRCPCRRFRQSRQAGTQSGRCPAGCGTHSGRAVQRAGRAASAAP